MTTEPDVESKYANNGKVMVGTAILLFIIIIVIIFFHTYVRFCRRRRRRRLFSHSLPSNNSSADDPCLDPSVIKSLPTFTFSAVTHRSLQDCAVCLSEFAEGDEGRVLPNCKHAFHAHCIDTWFGSHSTCPLCRTPVQPATGSADTEPGEGPVSEPGEGCSSSSLPPPIGCPRKPLAIIVEIPEVEIRGSDPVTGDQGFRWSLKRFCNV